MAEIAGRLRIDPTTTSAGGSVLREFLEAVVTAIPTPLPAHKYSSKDKLLSAIVTSLLRTPISYRLNGGTITNDHLDDILHGIDEADARHSEEEGVRSVVPNEFDSDLDDMLDARRMALKLAYRRERAPQFRRALLDAYDARCAITNADNPTTLEAAHIYPYRGSWTNAVQNGLLLRADIHRAFNDGELAIDTRTWTVVVASRVARTTLAREVAGRTLRLPSDPSQHPSVSALDRHRSIVGL